MTTREQDAPGATDGAASTAAANPAPTLFALERTEWLLTGMAALVMLTLLGCGGARPAAVPSAGSSASEAPAQAFFVGSPALSNYRGLLIHPSSVPGEVHASMGNARMILSSVPEDGAASADIVAIAEQRAWANIEASWQCGDRYVFSLRMGYTNSLAFSDTYLGDLTAVTPGVGSARVVTAMDGLLLLLDYREGRAKLFDCRTREIRDLAIPNDPPVTYLVWTPPAGVVALTNGGAVYRAAHISGPFERTSIRYDTGSYADLHRDGTVELRDGSTTHRIPASPPDDRTVRQWDVARVWLAQVPPELSPWFMDVREPDYVLRPGYEVDSAVSFPLRDGRWFRDGRVYDAEGRSTALDLCVASRQMHFNGGMMFFCRDEREVQFVTSDGRLRSTTLPLDARPWSWIADPLGPYLLCHACGPNGSTPMFVGDEQEQQVWVPSLPERRPFAIRGGRILFLGGDWGGYWVALDGTIELLRLPGTQMRTGSLSDDGVLSLVTDGRNTDPAPRFWAAFNSGALRELTLPPQAEVLAFARADLGFAAAGATAEERRAWVSRDRGETWLELTLGLVGISRDEDAREAPLMCSRMGCRWHDVWLGVPPPGAALPPIARYATPPAQDQEAHDLPRSVAAWWGCAATWTREPMYPRLGEDDGYRDGRRRMDGSYVGTGLAVEVRGRRARLHVAGADESGPFEWTSAWGFESSPDGEEHFDLLAASRDAALVRWCQSEEGYDCTHWFIRRRRDVRRVALLDDAHQDRTFRIHRGTLRWIQYSEPDRRQRHLSWTPEGGAVVVEESAAFTQFSEVRGEPRMMLAPSRERSETWLPEDEGGDVRVPAAVPLCTTPGADERLVDLSIGLARVQVTPDGVCLRALQTLEERVWVQPNGEDTMSAEVQRFGGTVTVTCYRGREAQENEEYEEDEDEAVGDDEDYDEAVNDLEGGK